MESSGEIVSYSGGGNTVYTIPEIYIDDFYTESLPDINNTTAFILTRCTVETSGVMTEGSFLLELYKSPVWKLYLTDIAFGYLKYAEVTNPTGRWNEYLPKGFLDALRDSGKIIVLKKQVQQAIHFSPNDSGRTISITHLSWGLITQMFEFEISRPAEAPSKTIHIGTSVIDDILILGKYPIASDINSKFGFPIEFKDFSLVNDLSLNKSFAKGLQLIRNKLDSNKALQFELIICSNDKLIDLWYMKHLSGEFGWKVHISEEYGEFVKNHIPQFLDSFSVDSIPGECRFHYDCCELSNNEDWDIDCEVEDLWIGLECRTNLRVSNKAIKLPFIHEI